MNNIINPLLEYNDLTINIIDGQSESEIIKHLIANDTFGYDPCLPKPFPYYHDYYLYILIKFNSSNVHDSNQWLPSTICTLDSAKYRNVYLFDGAYRITINNLMIKNYSHYPIVRSESFYCYDCEFINISNLDPLPLFNVDSGYDSGYMRLEDNHFESIQLSGAFIYGNRIVLYNTSFFDVGADSILEMTVW